MSATDLAAPAATPVVPALRAVPPAAAPRPLLKVSGLRVELASGDDVVSDISFAVEPGHIVGLVGESGSGKSTVAAALLGHARAGARIAAGQVRVGGVDLLALPPEALRRARGRTVAHVAQDPASALDPLMRVGRHLDELLEVHAPTLSRRERATRVQQAFSDVALPDDVEFLRRFPHQLSGGQQQRVLLALAFVLEPQLIVLDEPTTALDVTTQTKVLDTVRTLCRRRGVAAVYVSHDLAVVRRLADRVIVLYAGRIVEEAPLAALFDTPRHPYTQGLLAAIPDVAVRRALQPIPGQAPLPGQRAPGCAFAPRCPLRVADCGRGEPAALTAARDHRVACIRPDDGPAFAATVAPVVAADATGDGVEPGSPPVLSARGLSASYGARQVLHDVSFDVGAGRCLAIVGESGSGKTTLARLIAGLGDDANGDIDYDSATLPMKANARSITARRELQYIFQNPYRSLNPRHTVGETLATAARHFFALTLREADERAAAALEQVSLPRTLRGAYPRELSGGERQRVAIARALVCRPKLLVCDEITSSLDVSVQSTILDLLARLQRDGLAVLFVTHDLGVVRALADDVLVLRHGRAVEHGPAARVLDAPAHPYTRRLVADSPSLSAALVPPVHAIDVGADLP